MLPPLGSKILEDIDEAELVVGEIIQKGIMSPKELDMIE